MTIYRSNEYLISLFRELLNLPKETEWLEFKYNNAKPAEIGEYLSALANSAALLGKVTAYMVWGVDNTSHSIVGTTFKPSRIKIGNEELESWLLRLLSPKIHFRFHELPVDSCSVVILEIGAAFRHPVRFMNNEHIRIGSYKKKLKDYPEKERKLWRIFDEYPFEREVAVENINAGEVLRLLDYPAYFELTKVPLPENREGILDILKAEEIILESKAGQWNITNLGAALFAKKLSDFRHLKRKAIRVILYKDKSRVETVREQVSDKGYAAGYENLIGYVTQLLPSNEVIGQALRKEIAMFPELAIRELVANALIHQDFHAKGTSTTIEIFSNRMEITNPGLPLVKTDRFLDSPPKSRNEAIASFMRRIGVCEERGSGVDKVVLQTEIHQLPAPIFETTDEHTRVILFEYKKFKDMSNADRIRACYLHAALKYVEGDIITNTTLRERFAIDPKNSAMVSRVISDTINAGRIRRTFETVDSKARKYLPWWA